MPRFLALDYLSQAVGHRRCQLESMMVAPPHHMEIVNVYVHKGQSPDTSYTTPWRDQEVSVEVVISCSTETVDRELRALTNSCAQGKLEEISMSSECGDTGSEVDLFSQDIVSAMREMGCGGRGVGGEDYPLETLCHWETLTTQVGDGECMMECPESPNRVDTLLSLLPTVDDLCSRLKPKLIQDPFLDESGQPYSYVTLFRCDLTLEAASGDPVPECGVWLGEEFEADCLTDCLEGEIDPLFALAVPNEGEPLSLLGDELELPVLPGDSLEGSPGDKMMDESKDLTVLMGEMVGKALSVKDDQVLELSPANGGKGSELDFPTLNDQDLGGESDDSGIGHAILESPLLPPPHGHAPSPLMRGQLALLVEPIPTSPDGKLVFLSQCSERRLQKEVWEREKSFDTVLTNTFPYPDTAGVVEALLGVTDVVGELCSLLRISELKINGDYELDLPWDPLSESYDSMDLVEDSLVSRHPSPATPPSSDGSAVAPPSETRGSDGREWFPREEVWCDEIVELPLEISREKRSLETLFTQAGPSHVHSITQAQSSLPHHVTTQAQPSRLHTVTPERPSPPHVHPKDAAWNLLLQSTAAKTHGAPPTYKTSGLYKPLSLLLERSRSSDNERSPPSVPDERGVGSEEGVCGDRLDAFLMLRSSLSGCGGRGTKRSCVRESMEGPVRKKSLEDVGNDTLLELDIIERTATPIIQDVCLSGPYLSTVLKLEEIARELCDKLKGLGLRVPPGRGGRAWQMSSEAVKFLLKQQQKILEDSNDPVGTELCLRNCQLVASLYLTVSLLGSLFHCSLGVALVKLTTLCDKYHSLLGGREDPVKRELLALQLSPHSTHPKLLELVRLVTVWRNKERGGRNERAVIVVESEFPTLSGEILDMLHSIPGLKSCVFSLIPDSAPSQLYLKAVQDRFQLYDTLVVPVSSLTVQESFPWERVSLLVEYQELGRVLFQSTSQLRGTPSVTVADRLNLRKYVTLRTVEDFSSSERTRVETAQGEGSPVQHTLIASERVVSNRQLLQLLETRHNTLIVERDFHTYQQRLRSKCFSYCDILIDHSTGVLLRPLTLLSSDQGVRALVSTLTALSFQLVTCWVLLHIEDEGSYPYGGSITTNLARLHASIAHYCPKLDQFTVRVLITTGSEQVASWLHTLTQLITHSNCEQGAESDEWVERDWVETEISKTEMVLLSFPCINSFSALGMLKKVSLSDLFQMTTRQLQSQFPWMPQKIAKMFHSMCHSGTVPELGDTAESAYFPSAPSHKAATTSDEQTTSSFFTKQDVLDFQPPKNLVTLDASVINSVPYLEDSSHSIDQEDVCVSLNDSLEDGESVIKLSADKHSGARDLAEQSDYSQHYVASVLPRENVLYQPGLKPVRGFNFFERDKQKSSFDSGMFFNHSKHEPRNPLFESSSTVDYNSASVRLLSSSKRTGKTPSQKQIRESVLDDISGSTTSRTVSTSGFKSHLGYISSSAVKTRPSSLVRTPIKSLDLGFEGRNPPQVFLQCNDRTVGSGTQAKSSSLSEGFFEKSFMRSDSLVPSHTTLSPSCASKDTSLFDSPEGILVLSPAKKRRLSCQRDPRRTDGQTKLVLF